MNIYLQGLTMGLAYVAPIGLQNLFVINTALTQRRSRVYLTALIVIFFDITLGLACFLGVGALMSALPWLQKVILGIGSLIVIWIGIGLLRSKASMEGGKDVNVPIWKVISSACVVTWFNPQAIIDGTMMLGAFRASLPAGTDAFFIGGFASASILWFLGISTGSPSSALSSTRRSSTSSIRSAAWSSSSTVASSCGPLSSSWAGCNL